MFRTPNLSPIGIDFGSSHIKCVQLATRGDSTVLHARCSITRLGEDPLPTPVEAARLAAVLRRQGFSGTTCACAIPVARMIAAALELPSALTGAPLDAIARQELARSAKAEPSSFEFTWWPLPSGARTSDTAHALAMGCRHDDASAIVAAFEGAGLEVAFIHAPPTVLAATLAPLAAPQGELTGVLDFGHSAVTLLVLFGSTIVYERVVPASGSRLIISAVGNQFGLDAETAAKLVASRGLLASESGGADPRHIISSRIDAIADEVSAASAYAGRRFNAPLSTLLLVGGAAAMPGLAERLATRLELQTTVATPDALGILPAPASGALLGPSSMLALGLASAELLAEASA